MMTDFWEKVKSGTRELASKTNDALEVGKVKLEMTNLNRQIDRCYREIGKLIVEQYEQGNETLSIPQETFRKHLSEIKRHRDRIAELKASVKREE